MACVVLLLLLLPLLYSPVTVCCYLTTSLYVNINSLALVVLRGKSMGLGCVPYLPKVS